MKISKNTKFKRAIPSALNNNLQSIVLPQGIIYEDLVAISSLILRLKGRKSKERKDTDYISISKILFENEVGERKIGTKKLYSMVTLLLEDAGVISVNRCSKKGSTANKYMVNYDQYDLFTDMTIVVEIQNSYLNKKTKENIESVDRENNNRKKNIVASGKSISNYRDMLIDFEKAMEYLRYVYNNKIPYNGKVMTNIDMQHMEMKLKHLNEGERNISVCQSNGRVETDITNLRSDFRQFIIGDNLHILDASNSQPLLIPVLIDLLTNPVGTELSKYIVGLMKNAYGFSNKKISAENIFANMQKIPAPNEKELKLYLSVVESGKFYEYLQDWFHKNKYDIYDKKDLHIRENMKEKVFSMFYDKYESTEFTSVFPSISKYVESIKKILIDTSHSMGQYEKEARLFPIIMQGIESFIWIQNIQPKLTDSKIVYYSIHDCVIVPKYDIEMSLVVIKSVYQEYRLSPNISVERTDSKSLMNPKKQRIEYKKARIGLDFLTEPIEGKVEENKVKTIQNVKYYGEINKPLTDEEISKLFD